MAVNKNRLFITGHDDLRGLEVLAEHAEKCVVEPQLLSTVPLRMIDGRWETWTPDKLHPLYQRFKSLERKSIIDEYAQQKKWLDKLNETQDIDMNVANLLSMIHRASGEEFTFVVWPEDVPTLLPQAERVFFFKDKDHPQLVAPWQKVVETIGHMMIPEPERTPPRWYVVDFPTEEQLQQMEAKELE